MQYPQINKALLVPVIALIALLIKQVAHIEIGHEQMDVIIDGILAVITLVGMVMQPHKTVPAPPPPAPSDPPASVLPPMPNDPNYPTGL